VEEAGPGGTPYILADPRGRIAQDEEILKAQFYQQMAQKKPACSDDLKRQLIELEHPRLSIRRQYELLGLSRIGLYYEPRWELADNQRLIRLLDEQYTRMPYYGIRRMAVWLQTQGYEVNYKRLQRLLRLRGLEAIDQKPRLSQLGAGQPLCPAHRLG
jgi:putative transposase